MDRAEILDQAKTLINGDRADQYGDAYDTHHRIAQMWNAVLGMPRLTRVEAHDVALMMICVKIIRAAKNPYYADSWVDIAGYAAIGGEMPGAEAELA